MIEIRLAEKVAGGWKYFESRPSCAEEVGFYIREGKTARGRAGQPTATGVVLMAGFSGNITEISECYKAASEEHWLAWAGMTAEKAHQLDSMLAGVQ